MKTLADLSPGQDGTRGLVLLALAKSRETARLVMVFDEVAPGQGHEVIHA